MDDRARARQAVRDEMARQSISNAELARRTGLDIGTVGDFLAGDRWPRKPTLARIDEALGWVTGSLDRIAQGLGGPTVRPEEHDAPAALLDVDLSDLPERDREYVIAAARLRALEVAREVRRALEE